MHVKFIVDPSWYGPTTLSITAAPISSRMVMCVGGTESSGQKDTVISHWEAVRSRELMAGPYLIQSNLS